MNSPPALLVWMLMLGVAAFSAIRDIRRHPAGGYFRPAAAGMVAAVVFSVMVFAALRKAPDEEMRGLREALSRQLSQAAATAEGSGAARQEQLSADVEMLLRLYPGLQCLMLVSLLAAMSAGARVILAKRGKTGLPGPLSRWQAPFSLVWVVLIPAAVVLSADIGLARDLEPWIRDLCLNALVVVLPVFLFQGLLVLVEGLARRGIPKLASVLFLSVVLVLSFIPLGRGFAVGILFLGLLDPWFDFRKVSRALDDDKRR